LVLNVVRIFEIQVYLRFLNYFDWCAVGHNDFFIVKLIVSASSTVAKALVMKFSIVPVSSKTSKLIFFDTPARRKSEGNGCDFLRIA